MRRFCPFSLLAVALLSVGGVSAAEPNAAQKLATLINDRGCNFVPEAERTQWREASASDFAGSDWESIMRHTDNPTPWRAEGDYNGDGLIDTAKVVIRKADGRWMFGVDFGHNDQVACARHQIASDTVTDQPVPIQGLRTLPRGDTELACFHLANSAPLLCRVPKGSLLAKRKLDALVAVDAKLTYVKAFLWGQFEDKLKQDGTPLMAFNGHSLEIDYSVAAATDAFKSQSAQAQAGDNIDPAQRKLLVAEFDAAFASAYTVAFRATTVYEVDGKQVTEGFTGSMLAFQPPASRVTKTDMGAGGSLEMIQIDGRGWSKTQGQVQDMGTLPPIDSNPGANIGSMKIVSIEDSHLDGKPVRVLTVSGIDLIGTEQLRTITIGGGVKRPLRETSTDARGMVAITTYDYSAFPAITPPQ